MKGEWKEEDKIQLKQEEVHATMRISCQTLLMVVTCMR